MGKEINMTVREAAEAMGVSPMFVYIGLRKGRFPFGSAVKTSSRWTYHISRPAFERYMEGKSENANGSIERNQT